MASKLKETPAAGRMGDKSAEQARIAGLITSVLAEAAAVERRLDRDVPNADEARQATARLRAFLRELAAYKPARISSEAAGPKLPHERGSAHRRACQKAAIPLSTSVAEMRTVRIHRSLPIQADVKERDRAAIVVKCPFKAS
jgi:hypothetical protein